MSFIDTGILNTMFERWHEVAAQQGKALDREKLLILVLSETKGEEVKLSVMALDHLFDPPEGGIPITSVPLEKR